MYDKVGLLETGLFCRLVISTSRLSMLGLVIMFPLPLTKSQEDLVNDIVAFSLNVCFLYFLLLPYEMSFSIPVELIKYHANYLANYSS